LLTAPSQWMAQPSPLASRAAVIESPIAIITEKSSGRLEYQFSSGRCALTRRRSVKGWAAVAAVDIGPCPRTARMCLGAPAVVSAAREQLVLWTAVVVLVY
jgi:hypothetical protein